MALGFFFWPILTSASLRVILYVAVFCSVCGLETAVLRCRSIIRITDGTACSIVNKRSQQWKSCRWSVRLFPSACAWIERNWMVPSVAIVLEHFAMTTEMPHLPPLSEDALKMLTLSCIRLILCRYWYVQKSLWFWHLPYSRIILAFLWMYCMLFMHPAWFSEVKSINKLTHFFLLIFISEIDSCYHTGACSVVVQSDTYFTVRFLDITVENKIHLVEMKVSLVWIKTSHEIQGVGREALTLKGVTGMYGTQDPPFQGTF